MDTDLIFLLLEEEDDLEALHQRLVHFGQWAEVNRIESRMDAIHLALIDGGVRPSAFGTDE
jgi:hypothetical protein